MDTPQITRTTTIPIIMYNAIIISFFYVILSNILFLIVKRIYAVLLNIKFYLFCRLFSDSKNGWGTEGRGRWTVDGGQRSEDGGRWTVGRGRWTEDGGQRAVIWGRCG